MTISDFVIPYYNIHNSQKSSTKSIFYNIYYQILYTNIIFYYFYCDTYIIFNYSESLYSNSYFDTTKSSFE